MVFSYLQNLLQFLVRMGGFFGNLLKDFTSFVIYFDVSMQFSSEIFNIRSLCGSQFIFYMTKSDHLMRSEN